MTQWQTTSLPPESVRLALVQQFFEKFATLQNTREMEEIEEAVKYIYQSK